MGSMASTAAWSAVRASTRRTAWLGEVMSPTRRVDQRDRGRLGSGRVPLLEAGVPALGAQVTAVHLRELLRREEADPEMEGHVRIGDPARVAARDVDPRLLHHVRGVERGP